MSVWSGHDDIPPKNLDDLDGITLNIENAVIIVLLITMKARLVITVTCDKTCQQNVVIGNMHLLLVHHNNNSITRPASKTFMKHSWSLEARLVITLVTDNTCQQNVVIGNMYLLSVHHNNNSLTRPASETFMKHCWSWN